MFNLPSAVSKLNDPLFQEKAIEVYIKRDDLIHEEISGNKWRKLKHNVKAMQSNGLNTMLTFGGAFSNHIAATAAAGKYLDFNTVGIIRGEELKIENPTLKKVRDNGMRLKFISRSDYRLKNETFFIERLRDELGEFQLVEEGGANELGRLGCEEIIDELNDSFDVIALAAGTGTTAAGILRNIDDSKLLVVAALKNGAFLRKEIDPENQKEELLDLQTNYHFGGYAKVNDELLQFMHYFNSQHQIMLDQVYTAKLFFALYDLIKKNHFKPNQKLLAIHTGGLQGNTLFKI